MVGTHLSIDVMELTATGRPAAGESRGVLWLVRQFAINAELPHYA